MISQLTCPVCKNKIVLGETSAMPFCSDRCRTIDLGRWLDEGIGVPVEPGTYQEEQSLSSSDSLPADSSSTDWSSE